MKAWFQWRAIGLTVGVAVVALAVRASLVEAQPAAANPRVQWEYRILELTGAANERELNTFGAEGWELVAFGRIPGSAIDHYVFKRTKPR